MFVSVNLYLGFYKRMNIIAVFLMRPMYDVVLHYLFNNKYSGTSPESKYSKDKMLRETDTRFMQLSQNIAPLINQGLKSNTYIHTTHALSPKG
jgi:hypothetical protein